MRHEKLQVNTPHQEETATGESLRSILDSLDSLRTSFSKILEVNKNHLDILVGFEGEVIFDKVDCESKNKVDSGLIGEIKDKISYLWTLHDAYGRFTARFEKI